MFTSAFDLNLSEASIVEIIDVFVDFKSKSNPAYKSLNIRGVIVRVQDAFKCITKDPDTNGYLVIVVPTTK